MPFEMNITDVFRLSDGRTVFAGRIPPDIGLIGHCRCELRLGSKVRQVIDCEGEQIVKKIDPNNDLRSVATTDKVELTVQEAQSGEWRLVG